MTLRPIRSDTLSPLTHGFFTREGGVSTGIYEGLNGGQGSRDDPDAVAENRARIAELIESGSVQSLLKTNVIEVREEDVALRHDDGRVERLPFDAVIVQVGGTPPTGLLEKAGVHLVEKRGEE